MPSALASSGQSRFVRRTRRLLVSDNDGDPSRIEDNVNVLQALRIFTRAAAVRGASASPSALFPPVAVLPSALVTS